MERSHGEGVVAVKTGKTKVMICGTGLGLLQSSGELPMRCMSYRSRQQQHLLQWLQTLGA